MKSDSKLLKLALSASSPEDLDAIWELLAERAPYVRPVGDRWGNRGLFTAAGGSFDLKLIELISNMHDALVLSEAARQRADDIQGTDGYRVWNSPQDAVRELFVDRPRHTLASLASVELRSGGENRRDRTLVFRDNGIGMTADEFPGSLFRVGSSRKDGILWQLGAFGRGGLAVLPNCYGWIVVSRKQTDGTPAPVVITTVRWERVGNRQTLTALYQVSDPWEHDGDRSFPPTLDLPTDEFAPGTHLAVIAFHADGIAVSRLGDERSLDTVIDTRLFEPALPLSLTTPALGSRGDRTTVLRGLGHRLADNPRTDRAEGAEELPISYRGSVFRLPIRYYLFPAGDIGSRRRFVARDHALLLTSNGQVHAHWSTSDFRQRTRLPKLAERILVVAATDALPLELRTTLFTADRTDLVRNSDAIRLEEELVAFLDDWDELRDANAAMVRDAIRRSNADRSTRAVANRISRVLSTKAAAPQRNSQTRDASGRVEAPRTLLADPTELAAPAAVAAIRGRTKSVHISLNAADGFVPRRADLVVDTTHLDIDPKTAITVGDLRSGRLRVTIAVPNDAELGDATLTLKVSEWLDGAGSLRPSLVATSILSVVDDPGPGPGRAAVAGEAQQISGYATIGLLWTSHEVEDGWGPTTVGSVETVEADILASAHPDYAELRGKNYDVPVVKLNEEFSPLKAYVAVRARNVGDEGVARAKDRYALGVGVQLMLLDASQEKRRKIATELDEQAAQDTMTIAARGVLAVLPDYDALTAEVGLDDL